MQSIRGWLTRRWIEPLVTQRVQAALAARDDGYWRGLSEAPTERPWWEVRTALEDIHRAYRENPLAARLVRMTTDFCIGSGPTLTAPAFVQSAWAHPLNRLDQRIYAWCDELSLSGELFLVLSVNPVDGMSYLREVSALKIDQIRTSPDDLERELAYHQMTDEAEGLWWPAAGAADLAHERQVMLHYTVNKGVGETRGTSDLAQICKWLQRYDLWLEDRVRINRYKGSYLWHVTLEGALPGQIEGKRAQYSRPPSPGSIVVTDGLERWEAIQPQIGADDVEADGKAIRLMIAAGAGVPLHFLAEGESATRATAREMGTATFRHFTHRQHVFASIVQDVLGWIARLAGQPAEGIAVAFEPVMAESEV